MKWATIKRWTLDIFTEEDGLTIDPVRAGAVGGSFYGFVCHAYQTFWQHVQFDMLSFSGGLAAILGVLGMYLKTNKKHVSEAPKEENGNV